MVDYTQLQENQIEIIVRDFTFPWTTEQASREKWQRYFQEQIQHKRFVYIVQYDTTIIGYGSLFYKSEYPYFQARNIPEIHDIWISEKFRNQGYATKLIAKLEQKARELNYHIIGLGVGLYKDYGAAQKLYVKLGYIPDGIGVTYKYMPIVPGEKYCLDDDLILWFTKKLN
jgi:RimJ/RimL family protein N-acetyltransferase